MCKFLQRAALASLKMAELRVICVFTGVIFSILTLFLGPVNGINFNQEKVIHLQPNEKYECCSSDDERSDFKITCYKGQEVHLLHLLQSAFLKIDIKTDKYDLYEGRTVTEVNEQYAKDQSSWSITLWTTQRSREVQLQPFNTTCVGINTSQDFSIQLIVLRISYYRLISLLVGMVLFFMAPKLGRNTVFHYLSGMSFGVLASVLIAVFFVGKLFPRKQIMYTIMGGGWVVVVYLLNLAWSNARFIFEEYRVHITCYVVLSAAISFIMTYRLGPVTNERSMNIIQWALQFVGIVFVLLSSHFQEATVGIVILMLTIHNFPKSWTARCTKHWCRWFPPKQQLLSLEEYEIQSVVETEKALKHLREYCSSPESNPWKLQLSLKNPGRFARFVQGESHLTDNELMEYNVIKLNTNEMLTDDDDSDY